MDTKGQVGGKTNIMAATNNIAEEIETYTDMLT